MQNLTSQLNKKIWWVRVIAKQSAGVNTLQDKSQHILELDGHVGRAEWKLHEGLSCSCYGGMLVMISQNPHQLYSL